MKMRSVVSMSFSLAVWMLVAAIMPAGADERPNVILITCDALRPDHLGCYGYTRPTSPNLDALAARGARFTQALTVSTLTKASIASLFTSLYPKSHGTRKHFQALSSEPQTLAQILKQNGWHTVGAVSHGWLSHHLSFDRGFEEYFDDTNLALSSPRPYPGADKLSEALCNALDRVQGKPFFVYAHIMEPHPPYTPPEPFKSELMDSSLTPLPDDFEPESGTHHRANTPPEYVPTMLCGYDALIKCADFYIGNIVRKLEQMDIASRTIIIIASDHGQEFLEHDGLAHYASVYDESMRIPLIMAGPSIPKEKVIDSQVRSIDIAPTILELCSLPIPSQMEGKSLVPLLKGESWKDDVPTFCEVNDGTSQPNKLAVRTPQEKYIYVNKKRAGANDELYDLKADPGEKKNLLLEEPSKGDRLKKLALDYLASERVESVSAQPVVLDQAARERLRALGYLGGQRKPSDSTTKQEAPNLIPNGSLEEWRTDSPWPADWWFYGNKVAGGKETDGCVEGKSCVKVIGSSNARQGLQVKLPAADNLREEHLVLRFWAKSDIDGTVLTSSFLVNPKTEVVYDPEDHILTRDWQEFFHEFTVLTKGPVDEASVLFYMTESKDNFYLDAVSLSETP